LNPIPPVTEADVLSLVPSGRLFLIPYLFSEAERLAEETGNSLVSMQDMKKRYYMVETEAYFVAYRHVLSGLQGWKLQLSVNLLKVHQNFNYRKRS